MLLLLEHQVFLMHSKLCIICGLMQTFDTVTVYICVYKI